MPRLHIATNFSLPLDAVTQTFAILAKRGAGKTFTALVMTEEMLKASLQVVVVDPIGVTWGLRASADGKHAGLPIIILGGEHADAPLEVTAGGLVADFVVEERASCVLDLSRFRKGEQVRFMTDFCERLYHRNRSPLHLILDEADSWAPQRPMKGTERLLGAVEDLIRRGRARGIGATLVTQRAAVLNKNILTQIEVLVALRTISPQDRAAIDAWIEVHGTPIQREQLMTSLPSLPIGAAWLWSPGWLDVFQRITVRKRDTFDSSATPTIGRRPAQPRQLAEIDLVALTRKMAATIERAQADNPQTLRHRIAELERQIISPRSTPVAPTIQPIEINVIKPALVKQLGTNIRALSTLARTIGTHADRLSQACQTITTHCDGIQAALTSTSPSQRPIPSSRSAPSPSTKISLLSTRILKTSTPSTRLLHPLDDPDHPRLGLGERRILQAIAQHANGVTRQQLTVLTGYKRSSRDAYLQRLRERNLINARSNRLTPTHMGIAKLGPDFELLPTGEALQRYWLDRLPRGERILLEILVKAHPQTIDRLALDEHSGFKRSSRDAYLQRLKARELIENTSQGTLKASDTLFE